LTTDRGKSLPTLRAPLPSDRSKGQVSAARGTLQIALRMMFDNSLFIAVPALIIYFGFTADNFLTVDNFRDMLRFNSTTFVVAVPEALLLIAALVDLSIGSVLAFGAVVAGLLMTHGVSPIFAALAGVAAGGVIGALNGSMIAFLDFSPIIVTLGMLGAVRGVTEWIAPNPVYDFDQSFVDFGTLNFLGVPYVGWLAIVIGLTTGAMLAFMPTGRHIFAVGVNREAAYLSGVRVRRLGFALYVATGAGAALGGVMLAAQLNSAPSGSLGVGFELDVLTAVLLGGVAFDGGRGSIRGVALGVAFLAILKNGLTISNSPAAVALFIQGLALVFAACLSRFAGTWKERAT
jgi:ribose transport system permease protein